MESGNDAVFRCVSLRLHAVPEDETVRLVGFTQGGESVMLVLGGGELFALDKAICETVEANPGIFQWNSARRKPAASLAAAALGAAGASD